ncbi:hypothetical protein [Tychonema sp. LEGE 07203]|uniref:hypothetical protein n=1 Tax=Tychonema sp. LEGE 07203 TaxID=1828671 RepID=UPI00187F120A|nr:hypothetical protein [Tychonema sp. LEGE 07203]MBE9094636.1 hypothetical protein [Tychonema sp. LEGE 07203]
MRFFAKIFRRARPSGLDRQFVSEACRRGLPVDPSHGAIELKLLSQIFWLW